MSSSDSFEDLLQQFNQSQPAKQAEPKVGEKVRGTVISIGEDCAFIDLGGKTEGRMELAALRDPEGGLKVAVGDPIEAAVTGKDIEGGFLMLGSQHGHKYHGLEEVRQAYSQGLPVQGQVTGAVKGGVEVLIAGLRAFCPASQVDTRFVEDLSEYVGQRLDFRVTKIEGGRRPNLVVSRRVILEEEQRQRAAETRAQLKEGAILPGVVTSLKDYGAFVDIGGCEGMIHISELAFGHIKHPSEILRAGQAVEVAILRIEPSKDGKGRDKIALSIRALSRDPWADAVESFPVGARVTGTVSRLQPFGAFVELAPGLDGLVHISELGAERRINHPSEVLSIGDTVEATVLGVDLERRRIALTLDASKQPSDIPDVRNYAPPKPAAKGGSMAAAKAAEPVPEKTMGSFGALLQESLNKKR
ncbi:S1 RNA-binding domain-containing protein [uncultured Thiodictyon sp.]|jgi:small subunit ribosomal protein S1|uniref:30S ribosomal protein S1 n=1 Tax=uncultured Thiodictyon sp. TaxID=1846217 RepID=UPI0025EBCBBE|nr:S1 RNA-binding domain-containing protein [uncultured Thiodictyon sp.]